MRDTSRLSIAAIIAATAALAWAAVLHWRAPVSAPCQCGEATSASAPAAPPSPLAQTVGPLAVKVNSLEERLDRLERGRPDAATRAEASADAGAEPTSPSAPRFVSLTPPHPAIRVEQLDNGAFAAHNSDPSLTGKMFVVEGRRADGTVEKISITVPAPEK